MAEEHKEHDLFSEDLEKRARALLEDTEVSRETTPEESDAAQESLDDINALLLSVGLSPIDKAPAPEPVPVPQMTAETAPEAQPEDLL
jgi:hypothetical protein